MKYDPIKKRAYYLANRERIRAYQAEYFASAEYKAFRKLKYNKPAERHNQE